MNSIRNLFALMAFAIAPQLAADPITIKQALSVVLPGVQIDTIKPAEIPGLYEVYIGPKILYVSENGRYVLQGKMVDLQNMEDITETKLAKVRKASLEKVGLDKMIVFEPKQEKYSVSVFTDIDCGYCRKLHSQIDQYLQQGIAIHYLFYPRAGIGSESYKKAVAVWCSDDRNKALTEAKNGGHIDFKTCDNPVAEHMKLANAMGANGTPLIITEKGSLLPGYVPPQQLAEILKQE